MSTAYETPFNKAILETLQNIAAALEGIRYQLSVIAAPPQAANKPVDPYSGFDETFKKIESGKSILAPPRVLESPFGLVTPVTPVSFTATTELPKQDPPNE